MPDGQGQATVMVMDAVDADRRKLHTILNFEGYDCLEAPTVDAALDLLAWKSVQLVVCDLELPGRNGMDLLKLLKPSIPETSVVVVSSVDDPSTALECLHRGAYGYLLKPCHPSEIVVTVAGALRRRTLELDARDREQVLQQKVKEQTAVIKASHEELALRLITASEHRDHETGAHVKRIGLYAAEMGRLLNWNGEAVDCLQAAAPMHDIGKIGVPDRILQKPGPLTDEEWVLMRRHTTMGAVILKGSQVPFIQMGARIAACHHEKWDGTGYPRNLHGDQIPMEARITSLVDVYDALSCRRHYKEAWPEEEVVSRMLKLNKERHFDPDLFDLFLVNLPQMREIRLMNPDEPVEDWG